MLTVPALVWRGGFLSRAVLIGGGVGLGLGILAWIDSGFLLAGVAVLVIVGLFYGIWMARRMARFWPAAGQLSGADRVAVVDTARRGERIEPRLAQAVGDYRSGMHASAEAARPLRWLLRFVLVVAVGTAVADAISGSAGNLIVSVIYLVMLVLEMFWWPKRQARLLANVDRAAAGVG